MAFSRCLTVQIAQRAHGRHRDVRQLLDCLPLQLGVQQPQQLQPATVVGWPLCHPAQAVHQGTGPPMPGKAVSPQC